MDASLAVTACFSGNELEILQNQRAIWELTLAFPALMASQQQAARPITVVNSPSHKQSANRSSLTAQGLPIPRHSVVKSLT
jgi:hypothetical protein